MRFHWYCSYRNECEYEVYGFPKVGDARIDVYRPLGWLEEHMRKDHNGDADSFQRNVVDAIGGAVIHHNGPTWNRWPEDLYRAFVIWLTENHAASLQESAIFRAKHPDIHFDPHPPLVIPRPIYFDIGSNQFQDEPWHQPAEVAA